MHLNTNKTGLVVGVFMAAFHLVWSLLVLVGWAQPLLDFVFTLHMISPVYQVMAFSWVNALGLIILTFVVGYVLGFVFAVIWNKLHRA